jgi:hypothetical protein
LIEIDFTNKAMVVKILGQPSLLPIRFPNPLLSPSGKYNAALFACKSGSVTWRLLTLRASISVGPPRSAP